MIMATKVAIVEDDNSIANMYKIKLQDLGYEVKIASNGVAGLELIREMKPDIILLDLMMPEMNGDEMLQKVRATSWGKDIIVVVLSNVSKSEMPKNLSELEVDKLLLKADYTPSQIATIVNNLTDKK
jgi:DNA-binding response OmpR family regulator